MGVRNNREEENERGGRGGGGVINVRGGKTIRVEHLRDDGQPEGGCKQFEAGLIRCWRHPDPRERSECAVVSRRAQPYAHPALLPAAHPRRRRPPRARSQRESPLSQPPLSSASPRTASKLWRPIRLRQVCAAAAAPPQRGPPAPCRTALGLGRAAGWDRRAALSRLGRLGRLGREEYGRRPARTGSPPGPAIAGPFRSGGGLASRAARESAPCTACFRTGPDSARHEVAPRDKTGQQAGAANSTGRQDRV